MVKNSITIVKSRHIDISIYYIRELVNKGAIRVKYILVNLQFANKITTNLHSKDFKIHNQDINLYLFSLELFMLFI